MKKVIAVLITVCLLLSVFCAFGEAAEEFVYRENVRFGDSLEQIRDLYNRKIYQMDTTWLLTMKQSLSGIPGSSIGYYFDEDKLNKITNFYRISKNTGYDKEINLEDYRIIEEGLIRKYGDPTPETSETIHYEGGGFRFYTFAAWTFGEGKQWVLPYGNHNVVIEHVIWNTDEDTSMHLVTYQWVETDAEAVVDSDL